MASCLLLHGPGARSAALKKAKEIGHLIAPPFGDGGLKVEEAREAMGHLLSTPLQETIGVLILGPMDEVSPKVADLMLKSIEEFHGDVVQPILWANDLGGVPLTIQSRCLDTWCPATGDIKIDEKDETPGLAWDLIEKARAGDPHGMPGVLKGFEDKNTQRLLGALIEVIFGDLADEKNRNLWRNLREVSCQSNPKPVEVLAVLMRTPA